MLLTERSSVPASDLTRKAPLISPLNGQLKIREGLKKKTRPGVDKVCLFDDVLLEHDGLPHVLPLTVHLKFVWMYQ